MTDLDKLVLRRATAARRLLGDPDFSTVVSDLMNHHHDSIAQTPDDDVKGREAHFRKMRAYQDVIAELTARVAAGDALAQQIAEDAEGASEVSTEE